MIAETISICVTVVLVIGVVLGSSLWACTTIDRQYQETVRACVSAGGQWVPQWSQEGSCIRPR